MAVKLVLAGLTLAAAVVAGCESHHDHHSRGDRDHSRDRVGNDTGSYHGGYYDRYDRYHRYDQDARPAGGRVEPDRDRDWDRHHDHNWDHDRNRDSDKDRYQRQNRQWEPNHDWD